MEFCGVVIYTNDVCRLVEFYEFVLLEKSEGDDGHSAFPNRQLAIYNPGDVKISKIKNMSLMYYVENSDEAYDRLSKHPTVRILNEPTVKPWGVKSFQFLDPDGNEVSFLSKM